MVRVFKVEGLELSKYGFGLWFEGIVWSSVFGRGGYNIGLRLSSRGPGCRVKIPAAEDLYGTNLASTGMYNERGAHASRDAAAQQHILYSQPKPPSFPGHRCLQVLTQCPLHFTLWPLSPLLHNCLHPKASH